MARRTGVKNRIHAVLHQRLIHCPVPGLFSLKGRDWLARLKDIDEDGRRAIDSELRLLKAVEKEVDELDDLLRHMNHSDPRLKLLMTLPGVDVFVALALLAALGDVGRFKTAGRMASYLGLVPSTTQSATPKYYHGPITKQGNSTARWMLIQAAQHVRRHLGPLGNFYRNLRRRKGHNIAVVATARKLAVYAWHLLTNNEPYRYAQPEPTQNKLQRLRIKVTGQRKKTGPKKGTPATRHHGTGVRTKRIPSLPEVYNKEGLPQAKTFDQLPKGEKKHLRVNRLVTRVKLLEKPHRVIKKPRISTTDSSPNTEEVNALAPQP